MNRDAQAAAMDPHAPAHRAQRTVIATASATVVFSLALAFFFVRRADQTAWSSYVDRGRLVASFMARQAELGVLSGNRAELRRLASIATEQSDIVFCAFDDASADRMAELGSLGASTVTIIDPLGAPTIVDGDAIAFHETIRVNRSAQSPEEAGFDDPSASDRGATTVIGHVTVGMSLATFHTQRQLTHLAAGTLVLLIAALALAAAWLLTRELGRSLESMAAAAAVSKERERLADMKTRFVANASHEFRTPLAVILSATDTLSEYAHRMTDGDRRKRYDKIRRSVRQMTDLLEDVLTVGQGDAGQLRCVRSSIDVMALCHEAVNDAGAKGADIGRVVVTGDLDRQQQLDGKLLRQILRNLVGNALKYSPAGGEVRIDVARDGDALQIRITDRGIGIRPEDQEHLFEAFHRGDNVGTIEGTGLGLAITERAVVAHGGTIAVESIVGSGTTFIVSLPLDGAMREAV